MTLLQTTTPIRTWGLRRTTILAACCRWTFAGALLFGLMLAPAGRAGMTRPTNAASGYDGSWLVIIVTRNGPCDASSTYPMRIEDGRVRYVGKGGFSISGQVDETGNVSVTISISDRRATANGRLASGAGAGRWNGGNGSVVCGGEWKAIRG
jgi:hypothetical protein